jgi:hypothetical protein
MISLFKMAVDISKNEFVNSNPSLTFEYLEVTSVNRCLSAAEELGLLLGKRLVPSLCHLHYPFVNYLLN